MSIFACAQYVLKISSHSLSQLESSASSSSVSHDTAGRSGTSSVKPVRQQGNPPEWGEWSENSGGVPGDTLRAFSTLSISLSPAHKFPLLSKVTSLVLTLLVPQVLDGGGEMVNLLLGSAWKSSNSSMSGEETVPKVIGGKRGGVVT